MKRALITGITGQDGAYLAQFLLEKGYQVFGAHRRSSAPNFWRLRALGISEHPNLQLVEHDLTDMGSGLSLIDALEPEEIYNLAAQSFVESSFRQPSLTAQITGLGVLNLLEAVRMVNRKIRFYQASTSEMFGKAAETPQRETTPFYPRSPYGVAKLFAHWATVNYRESYGIFAASGVLFNHESPLRGSEFVTRKISQAVAGICRGQQTHLELGNLDARRDWGYAKEYVVGMWKMLQAETPDTFVLATGRTATVRDFAKMAFRAAGISLEFTGTGKNEVGIDSGSKKILVKINPNFYRPAEVDLLLGDATKAREVLGWSATTPLEDLCDLMVRFDLENQEIKA